MNISLYLERGTAVHNIDARTKLFSAISIFGISLCFNHPIYVAFITVLVLAIGRFAKALSNIWRLRYILILLFAFSTITWPFFVEGSSLIWSWGPLRLSVESILYGLAMGLRLATFVATGILFISTTRNEELTNGLIRMGMPYGIAFAFSTALRLVPTFVGAGAQIIQAQLSRGLDLETGGVFKRIGKFIPQAVPLFIYAIHYTNYLSIALESKGFSPESKRTFYYEPYMKKRDYLVIFLSLSILAIMIYMRIILSIGAVIPGRI
jgi:energy-coupling factor transport system permease protein